MCLDSLKSVETSFSSPPNVKEITGVKLESVNFSRLIEAGTPVILKGVFAKKALVIAGQKSSHAAMAHVKQYHSGQPLVTFLALPEHKGRFFYDEDMAGMNFQSRELALDDFFAKALPSEPQNEAAGCYAGSTDLPTFFPNMIESDGLALPDDLFQTYKPLSSIWMGNRTTAAIHYDMSNNVAACMVGRRRFTLFPPDQIDNLYPGPIFPTPAGQVVSMVDLNAPDFERFPKFKEALNHAQVADLEAGDMLVYPAMWWHQVEALDDFNILINYWWNEAQSYMDSPMNAVLYSMLALRDRPAAEKQAWKHVFDYYVFGDPEQPRAHLPENFYGPLGTMDMVRAKRLRMHILRKLNR